jgi:sugar diacid utilization regulator
VPIPEQSARDRRDARARIALRVHDSLAEMIEAATEAIFAQVPGYAGSTDSRLRADVSAHVAAIFGVFLDGLADDEPARRAAFTVTREQASYRIGQGISLADFLQAFRIGQLTLWQSVLDIAQGDEQAKEAALRLVERIMTVIELGSTVDAEAYLEAQQHQLAESDRLRRDLVEDLLAYRTTFAGRKRSILQAAGLHPETRLLVASAAPVTDPAGHEQAMAAAATAIAAAGRGAGSGLATLRQDEIVGVVPLPHGDAKAAVASLQRTAAAQGAQGTPALAIGVSTVHAGLHEVPEAYAEAQSAREALSGADGVLALPLLTAFEYLVLREAQTAQRLIRPQVRRFVTEDAAAGGALIATLVEYARCDLNAKTAAERLHLHVNSAYYRLDRIAERTGYDLRKLADVVELLIAIRLLGGVPRGSAAPASS